MCNILVNIESEIFMDMKLIFIDIFYLIPSFITKYYLHRILRKKKYIHVISSIIKKLFPTYKLILQDNSVSNIV